MSALDKTCIYNRKDYDEVKEWCTTTTYYCPNGEPIHLSDYANLDYTEHELNNIFSSNGCIVLWSTRQWFDRLLVMDATAPKVIKDTLNIQYHDANGIIPIEHVSIPPCKGYKICYTPCQRTLRKRNRALIHDFLPHGFYNRLIREDFVVMYNCIDNASDYGWNDYAGKWYHYTEMNNTWFQMETKHHISKRTLNRWMKKWCKYLPTGLTIQSRCYTIKTI